MKKLTNLIKSAMLFAVMGLTFGLYSCSNDNLENVQDNGSSEKLYIIYGGFAQNDSRMSLNTTTGHYDWQVGDGVCLYKEDGSLLVYHAIEASEIQSNGRVKLALRLPYQPKYISIAGKNGDYTSDGAYVDVNTSGIGLYALNSAGVLNREAPMLGQAEITSTIVDGASVNAFSMQHKMAYVYIKEIKIDGVKLNNVYVSTVGAKMKIANIKDQNSEVEKSSISAVSANVLTGYVIAIVPGTTLIIAKDATSEPFVNVQIGEGFYTVSRDIYSNFMLTFSSGNTGEGLVSSESQSVAKGGAAQAVTAIPNPGFVFEGWYNGDTKLGASGTDENGNAYTVNGAALTITNAQSVANYTAKFKVDPAISCTYMNSAVITNGSLSSLQVVVGETYTINTLNTTGKTQIYVVTITGSDSYTATFDGGEETSSLPGLTVSGGYLKIATSANKLEKCSSYAKLCNNLAYTALLQEQCPETCGFRGGIVKSISAKKGDCTKTYTSDTEEGCIFLNSTALSIGSIKNMKVVVGETYTINTQSATGATHKYVITITGENAYSVSLDDSSAATSISGVTVSNGYLTIVASGDKYPECSRYAALCTNVAYYNLIHDQCPATCGYSGGTVTSVSLKNGNCSKTFAQVQKNYVVVYDANGGTNVPNPQTKTWGVNLKLSSTIPAYVKSDGQLYLFQGWALTSNATSVAFAAGATVTDAQLGKSSYNTEVVRLYAKWLVFAPANLTQQGGSIHFATTLAECYPTLNSDGTLTNNTPWASCGSKLTYWQYGQLNAFGSTSVSSYYGQNDWAKSTDPCYKAYGGSWRVPNISELSQLLSFVINSCKYTTVTQSGQKYIGFLYGSWDSNKAIQANTFFLPAAGWRGTESAGNIIGVGSGTYWASNYWPTNANWGRYIHVRQNDPFLTWGGNQHFGFQIRCVHDI